MPKPLVDLRVAGLVAAGGVVGVGLRSLLIVPVADAAPGLAVTALTLVVNLVGSFLLGVVVARLHRHPRARAFVGTGVLGGFTTYSAFAVQTVDLFGDAPVLGLLLVVVAVLGGVVAAALGLRAGRAVAAQTSPEEAE